MSSSSLYKRPGKKTRDTRLKGFSKNQLTSFWVLETLYWGHTTQVSLFCNADDDSIALKITATTSRVATCLVTLAKSTMLLYSSCKLSRNFRLRCKHRTRNHFCNLYRNEKEKLPRFSHGAALHHNIQLPFCLRLQLKSDTTPFHCVVTLLYRAKMCNVLVFLQTRRLFAALLRFQWTGTCSTHLQILKRCAITLGLHHLFSKCTY